MGEFSQQRFRKLRYGTRMKKVLLSGFVVFTFIGYAAQQRLDAGTTQVVMPPVLPSPTAGATPTPQLTAAAPSGTPPPTATPAPAPVQTSGQYRNGQYTGSVADAFYGNVQVKAIITNGKISDVQFLQYPNDRRTSQMINAQTMPYLTQEAIQAQSAQVDGVTGATQTSRAFIESLTSALNQAK
jgi:uncharacterized protein with FMN-binding domain